MGMNLTEKQEARVKSIKEFMLNKNVAGVPTHEIKAESLRPVWNGTVEYLVTAGIPNDEGTMAKIFCREVYQVFITPRGGLKVHSNGYGRKTKKHLCCIIRCMRG